MESVVSEIFEKLGGATKIANGVNLSVQTVHDWINKGTPEIPPWRREAVLRVARESEKLTVLSKDALAYLQSQARAPRKSAA